MLQVLTYNNYFNLGSFRLVIRNWEWKQEWEFLRIGNQYYVMSHAESVDAMFGPALLYPEAFNAVPCKHPLEEVQSE